MRRHKETGQEAAGGSPTVEDGGAGTPAEAADRPPAAPAARLDQRSRERNQKVLLGTGTGILVVLLCGGMFAAGFVVGNRSDAGGAGPGSRGRGTGLGRQQGTGPGQAGGEAGQGAVRQRVQQWLQQQGATLVRGQVTGVDDGNVNVRTPDGEQTIAVTESTRVLGAGRTAGQGVTGGGGSVARDLQQGERIVVAVRKGADGKLEALALKKVRAGAKQPAR